MRVSKPKEPLVEENMDEVDEDIEDVEDTLEGLEKPSSERIIGAVIVGILFSALFCFIVYGLYMKWIKYPPEQEINQSLTGLYCLENYENSLVNLESIGSDSYIAQEVTYANEDDDKLSFYKKVLGTIKYTPNTVKGKNIYGNDLMDSATDTVKYVQSTVSEGEEVTLTYVDYRKITPDETLIEGLMSDNDLKLGDVDYQNKLVDVFCQYMNKIKDLPTRDISYTPSIKSLGKGKGFEVTEDEDIYIDKLLFSSDDFYDLLDRFSVVAGKVSSGSEIVPTDDWTAWDGLSREEKSTVAEPTKYNYKDVVSREWCGTYYLQNEHTITDENGNSVKDKVIPQLGDGTFENPASTKTPVLTSVIVDGVEYPIKVEMLEYGVSEDAIKWFQTKDERNRGIDISSEVQYMYAVFRVTNLSNTKLTIRDNASLCDKDANLAPRTGTLYGITDSVTLEPDESGNIETWSQSVELNKKYLIWGADFARKVQPVWFRVLAGNIEDTSDDKGVTINKTRTGE